MIQRRRGEGVPLFKVERKKGEEVGERRRSFIVLN